MRILILLNISDLSRVGTPKFQEIPTQKSLKSYPTQKFQNFENCSQTWPKYPIFLGFSVLGVGCDFLGC